MVQDAYEIKIEKIFEGPMDLLLHLIRKNEVDIYDIPIAMITEQYLEYLQWLDAMNIDYAGDFLVMASSLAHIKSRMLLPSHEGEEDEDPRMEIARPLLEYMQLKNSAEKLAARSLLDEDVFKRPECRQEMDSAPDGAIIRIGLFELIDAFQKLLGARFSGVHRIDLNADRLSVTDRISQIVDLLEAKGSMAFDELFPPAAGKGEIVVTFLAVLEMAKLSLIQIVQHAGNGIIRILYL